MDLRKWKYNLELIICLQTELVAVDVSVARVWPLIS